MALAQGGREHYGWGIDRYLLAEIFDALNLNTRATGQWKKSPPEMKPFPRPKVEVERKKARKMTLRDLHKSFMAGR